MTESTTPPRVSIPVETDLSEETFNTINEGINHKLLDDIKDVLRKAEPTVGTTLACLSYLLAECLANGTLDLNEKEGTICGVLATHFEYSHDYAHAIFNHEKKQRGLH